MLKRTTCNDGRTRGCATRGRVGAGSATGRQTVSRRSIVRRILVAGIAALVVPLSVAAPAAAQDCNSDLTLAFVNDSNVSRLLSEKTTIQVVLRNEGPLQQTFRKIDFFPSCLQTLSGPGLDCVVDEGVNAGIPLPVNVITGPASVQAGPNFGCAAVPQAELVDLTSGLAELCFSSTPGHCSGPAGPVAGGLTLAPGDGVLGGPDTCELVFEVDFVELGAGATPNEQFLVLNQVESLGRCPNPNNPGNPLVSSNIDSGGVTFFDCRIGLEKQTRCNPGDPFGEDCVGWDGEPLDVQYTVTNAGISSFSTPLDCSAPGISDSNTLVLAGNLSAGTIPVQQFDGLGNETCGPNTVPCSVTLTDTDQLCSDALDDLEPDTGTVDCLCDRPGNDDIPIQANDTANFQCQESGVTLSKVCDPVNAQGVNEITLTVTNPNPNGRSADLTNCVVTDPEAGFTSAPFNLAAGASTDLFTSIANLTQETLNTASVTCDVVGGKEPVTANAQDLCEVRGSVDAIKECVSNNGDGTYTYNVKVTNTGPTTLEDCTLEETNPPPIQASCGPLSQTSLGPGQMATATCTSDSNMNMLEVVCDDGTELPVEDTAMAGCVDVDKQISCDGGATFIDLGYNDSVAEFCTGWNTTDPNDPNDPGREIVFRYLARTGAEMTDCRLTDTNTAVLPPGGILIGNLGAKIDQVIHIAPPPPDALLCDEVAINEPDVATLDCQPLPDEPGDPTPPRVSDSDDADLDCQPPPSVDVIKECASNNGDGTYTYNVKVTNTNPTLTLEGCVLTETNDPPIQAACGPLSATTLAPGAMATATCTSDSNMNMVRVDCTAAGKPASDEAMAGCVDVDKQISCDGGATFIDLGYNDSVAESCTGWNTTDPNDPNDPGREIVFRYLARTGAAMSDCVLTDSNTAVLPPGGILIGNLGAKIDQVIHTAPPPPDALLCDEVVINEPDLATLTCNPVPDEPGDPPPPPVSDSDDADLDCQPPPSVDVIKECASNNGDGTYTYNVKVTNTNPTLTLDNCVLTETNDPPIQASCGPLSQTTLAPGAMATATCISDSNMNMVRVDCTAAGKPASDEAMAGCVDVDKQISCDGGATFVDLGYNDNVAESCTGWNTTDPNDPNDPGREIVFRYLARTGAAMSDCVLTDTNTAVLPPGGILVGNLGAKIDQVIHTAPPPPDALLCDEVVINEPDVATLTCQPLPDEPGDPPPPPVSDTDDADLECETASVDLVKECASNNGDGTYTYDIKVTNDGTASLTDCRLVDPSPPTPQPGRVGRRGAPQTNVTVNCGQLSRTTLGPGEMATATCTSDSNMNMAKVICELAGTSKMVMDEDMAACVDVDKQISCDSGRTWNDEGYNDNVAESCVGWSGDPSASTDEIVVRWLVRTGGAMTECVLFDTNNVLIPAGGRQIGDLGAKIDREVHRTEILSCDEVLAGGEPDVARIVCRSVDDGNQVTDEDDADLECQEASLRVDKECSSEVDPDTGLWIYTVTATNTGEAHLVDCQVTDTSATGCDTSFASLASGESKSVTCQSEFYTNEATVTCTIAGTEKSVTASDEAECERDLKVDKQVSCDGGRTWFDQGFDDGVIDGCIGWENTDPEIRIRYLAETTGYLVNCELSDSNPLVLPDAVQVGTSPQGVIFETELLECSEALLQFEPNTATLSCDCLRDQTTTDTIESRDTAKVEDCQLPSVDLVKECRLEVDPTTGLFIYDVTVINTGEATLDNCQVVDTNASDCDQAIGTLNPGQRADINCLSDQAENTASVTCDIRGATNPDGSPKTIGDEDSASCPICELEVVKTCEVIQPPTSFDCDAAKPIDVLVMTWDGTETVDVVAHEGDSNDPVVGQVLGVVPGQEVRISGFADAPNDVIWEIFQAGTSTKLGESKFHLSCSDAAMNGPEDCGLPQGDGKQNDAGLLNTWRFEGLEGNGQVLDCTQTTLPPSDTCSASNNPTPCTKRPTVLSLRYTGEDCSASMNTQDSGSWDCTDFFAIDPNQPVFVTAFKKEVYLDHVEANVGDVLDIVAAAVGRNDLEGETRIEVEQGGVVVQEIRFHTSCSQDLRTGDQFGSMQVWSFQNPEQGTVQFGVEVIYEYKITNVGAVPAFAISVIDDPDPGDPFEVDGSPIGELQPNEMITLSSTRLLTETTTNVVTVIGGAGSPGGPTCSDDDDAIVFFEGFLVRKECAAQDANGDNAVKITLQNVGDKDLVCDVRDPLAGFVQNGLQLPAGATVMLDATVSGLVADELNTVTATCTEVLSGNQLPPQSDEDLCEVRQEPDFTIAKVCESQNANGVNHVTITLTNTGQVDLVCDVEDPLANFVQNGVPLPAGGAPVLLNAAVSGLTTDALNTVTATCTEQQTGTTLPEKSAQDLCEVEVDLLVSKECDPAQFDFCPRTPGFWKTHHPEDWPVLSLSLGGVVYDDAELLVFLNYGGPDGSTKLAKHLTATKLNLASGSEPSIQPVVDAADAFLAANPPGSDPQGALLDEALALKDALDFYNNTDCEFGQHPTTAGSQVTITVENPAASSVTLTNCVVTDAMAPNCDTVIPTLAPGEVEVIFCSAPDLMASEVNEVSVTCNLENSSETITRTAEDLCEVDVCEVIVDKQVDCGDGFIDVGDVDESCTALVGEPVTIRWLASAGPNNTTDLVECVLTDSNGVALGDPFLVGSPIDPSVVELELTSTTKECSRLEAGGEPDTARLVCGCAGQVDPDFTVEDRDEGNFMCVEPAFSVSKLCESQDAAGRNAVTITLTNTGEVDLVCDLQDPLAGFVELDIDLPVGATAVRQLSITGLTDPTLNTVSAICTEQLTGSTLPEQTDEDLCEISADCDLTVEKTCLVLPPPPTGFNCSDAKPIDVVSMIWDGAGTVDIKAWKGSVGSTLLGTLAGIAPGQEISVSGYAGSPNDVIWEVFVSGTNFGQKLGESKFHLSCSDGDMNGPEDCGKLAGDGKSDDAGLINQWRFEGLEGSGLVLDCTPTTGVPAESCAAELGSLPSCETVGDPDTLTWRYTGGGCAASDNSQEPGKSICSQSSPGIDGTQPVTVTDDQGNHFSLQPGEEFTTSRSASKTFYLSQPGRWEDHEIHVSCSQPLVAGESYGSLTIAALDGQRADVEVEYAYTVTNGGAPLANVTIVDDKIDLGIAPFDLASGETRQFFATARLEGTTENRVDVVGEGAAGLFCEDFDTAIVTVTEPPEPCFECAGGVTELAFRNLGPDSFVEIEDNNGLLFAGFLKTDEDTPAIQGSKSDGKFDGDVEIYRDGNLVADIHTSCSQPIGVGMEFGGFEVISGRSKDGGLFCEADCQPTQINFEVKDDELKMRIANGGQTPLQIRRIEVEWPAGKGNLEKIEFDGTIWEGAAPPTMFSVDSGFTGSPTARALDPGDDHDLKLRFKDKQQTGFHRLRVEFTNDCFLEATSDSPSSGSWDCSKPIDALTMIWDGAGTVDVTAWKGSVGSTNLGTQTVSQGQEVTFSGFAGSPNDVIWQIFQNAAEIGQSKFHLSCSDSEMNGPEDCGKRQGNGKGNEAGLINDWIFEGITDSDETFDCNP